MSAPTWTCCADSSPASDATVLAYFPEEDEPVWLAFHDGECWCDISGLPNDSQPTHWMDLPEGPK